MITDHFPPDPGGRSEKMFRHIKYLFKQGIYTDVLCPTTQNAPHNHEVIKYGCTCYRIKPVLWKLLPSLKWQDRFGVHSLVGKMYLLLRLPGGYLRWIVPAYLKSLQLFKTNYYKYIICVSNPLANQLLGLLIIKTRNRLQLISELRDPLVGYYWSRHLYFIDAFVEKIICKYAAAIIEWEDFSPSPLSKRHSKVTNKICRIPNVGYDPEEYLTYDHRIAFGNHLRLAYTGGYYGGKKMWEIFFRAFSNNIQNGLDMRFEYYGDWHQELQEIVNSLPVPIPDRIIYRGKVTKKSCIKAYEKSHVLIYVHEDAKENKNRISSKLYDYFATRRPILAILPKDSLAEKKLKAVNPETILSLESGWESNLECHISSMRLILKRLYNLQNNQKLHSILYNHSIEYSCIESENLFINKLNNT